MEKEWVLASKDASIPTELWMLKCYIHKDVEHGFSWLTFLDAHLDQFCLAVFGNEQDAQIAADKTAERYGFACVPVRVK